MTQDKEDVYDQEIAPLMTQIIDICKKHQMPMFATFEFAPKAYCETILPDETGRNSITFQLIWMAARAKGNGDILIKAMMDHAKKHGNGSAFLAILMDRLKILPLLPDVVE